MSLHSTPDYIHIKPRLLRDITEVLNALTDNRYDKILERWFVRIIENFRYDSWPEGSKPGVLRVFAVSVDEMNASRFVTEEWRSIGDLFNMAYEDSFSSPRLSREDVAVMLQGAFQRINEGHTSDERVLTFLKKVQEGLSSK